MKNFDFKKFMLEKGERVILAIAVAFTLLMVALGVWGLAATNSPAAVAETLNRERNRIDNSLKTFRPPEGFGDVQETLKKGIQAPVLARDTYVINIPFFVASPLENGKRQKVDVFAPEEFH